MANLGTLLEKLGRDAGLSHRDLLTLRQKGNNLEAIESAFNTWSDPGQSSPHFSHFYADEGEFGTIPLESFRMSSGEAQTITTSTETTLVRTGSAGFDDQDFGISGDGPTGLIDLRALASGEGSKFFYWWFIRWEDNTTGRRVLTLNDFDDNTQTVQLDNTNADAWGNVGTVTHSGSYWWGISGPDGDRQKFRVWQNSGGDLDVSFWRIGVFRIH